MSEFQALPLHVQDEQAIRYGRNSWREVGIDDFTQAPAQNPDLFIILNNILPPLEGVLLRRWGYRPFNPKVDAGANPHDDTTTP